MPSYTITAVSPQTRPWNSTKGGPMLSYRVTLQNGSGAEMENVEWARKADSPAPVVGQQVEGDVDREAQYGPKFKAAPQSYGGGGGGGRNKPPEERRSIAMQHAQKCAVTALQIAAQFGDYKPENASEVVMQVKTVAAVLFRQVLDAENPEQV